MSYKGISIDSNDVEHIGPPINNNNNNNRSIDDIIAERGLLSRETHENVINQKEHAFDSYATSKSNSQNMLNMSVINTLISILVNLFRTITIQRRSLDGFEISLVSLIALSLTLQFIIFVLLVVLAKSRTEQVTETITATSINAAVTSLSGLLLIVSSAISVLSIASPTTVSTASLFNTTSN